MNCTASGIDVIELRVINKLKFGLKHIAEPVVCIIDLIST